MLAGRPNAPDGRISFDSRRNRQANSAMSAASAAATSPGAWRPNAWSRIEPNAGPTTAPRLVTADSQPRLLVRCSGGVASAT